MQKQFYFLSPVEVVKVTSQNLAEVAEWCGGKVASTESKKVPGRMDSYVWVPTPKGTQVSWAFPGMFITKRLVTTLQGELRATWAVYRRDYFNKNYFDTPKAAVDATWEREALEKSGKRPKPAKDPESVPQPTEVLIKVVTEASDTPSDVMDKAMQKLAEAFPKADVENGEIAS